MAESKLEAELAWQIKAAKLPVPVREYRFAPPRRWRADFAWLLPRGLLVEVEGGLHIAGGGRHQRGAGYAADVDKYNAATLADWRLLRVTGAMIRDGRALRLIEQALEAP